MKKKDNQEPSEQVSGSLADSGVSETERTEEVHWINKHTFQPRPADGLCFCGAPQEHPEHHVHAAIVSGMPDDPGPGEPMMQSDYIRALCDLRAKRDALDVAIHALWGALSSGALSDPPARTDDTASRQAIRELMEPEP